MRRRSRVWPLHTRNRNPYLGRRPPRHHIPLLSLQLHTEPTKVLRRLHRRPHQTTLLHLKRLSERKKVPRPRQMSHPPTTQRGTGIAGTRNSKRIKRIADPRTRATLQIRSPTEAPDTAKAPIRKSKNHQKTRPREAATATVRGRTATARPKVRRHLRHLLPPRARHRPHLTRLTRRARVRPR